MPMKLSLVAALCLTSCLSQAQQAPVREERFFDWTQLQFPAETYAARRAALGTALGDSKQLFLCPAASGFTSGDTFRQLDDFLYFSGLELPNSVLVIRGGGAPAILFAPERDLRFESATRPGDFPGRPLALDPELAKRSGISDVRSYGELEQALGDWLAKDMRLHVNAGGRGPVAPGTDFVRRYSPADALLAHLQAKHPTAQLKDAFPQVARLRMRKDAGEIRAIRRACEITVDSILRSARFIRPGVDERTLEGELEAGFKAGGAQRPAFDSIIKSGPNSLWPWRILAAHYDRRNRKLQAGELVIFDVGCEWNRYASDLGRSFPVSGSFSPAQEQRLRMITAASDAVIAGIKPGVTFGQLRRVLLDKIPQAERKYMQASLFFGHHIGLEVGDASLDDLALEPGMVFTVEPWYYNHDEGLAVFIEDDVLVTEQGCENLSARLPRSPRALEALTALGAK